MSKAINTIPPTTYNTNLLSLILFYIIFINPNESPRSLRIPN